VTPTSPAPPVRPPLTAERWRRLAPLLDAALDLPPEQRDAFVSVASAGDPALRADLERLLAESARADTLLDRAAGERFALLLEEAIQELSDALADRYVVRREIGRGGMATVYLAHDRRHDREVAIKVLRRDIAANVGADRFLREIRTAARLQHPHIVPLHDSGESHGFLYYVMPFAAGESLRERLAREPRVPLDETLRIARDVAGALDHAHAAGIIHRDIKPENIMLSAGHALVMDFGIARAVSGFGGDANTTAAGVVVGTPAYMSPEQAASLQAIDGRSDVYALGCVVYEMLSGQQPFPSTTPREAMARQSLDPVPLLGASRPELPAAVQRAVARAMAKAPEDRFPTATAFVDACSQALPAVNPAAAPSPAPASASRTRIAWLAVAAAAVVALVVALWFLRPAAPGPDRSIAVLAFADLSPAGDNEYFSDGLTEEIITGLSAVPGLKVISRTSAMHYKGSGRPLREIAAELKVAHILEGSVRQSGTRVRITAQLIDARTDEHLWAKTYDDELRDVFRVQEQIARQVVQALQVELGDRGDTVFVRQGTSDPEAYQLYRRARYLWNTRTREGHSRAADYYRQAIARDSGYADAYAGLADTYLTSIQVNVSSLPPQETYARAKWAVERALALDDKSADAHATYGISLHWQHNWPGSERAFRRALQLNPNHANAHSWYALLLSGLGRPKEALEEARRSYELDPFAVTIVSNYGWQCYLSRDMDCALEQFRRTTEIGPRWGRGYQRLGLAFAQQGRLDEALHSIRKGIELSPERPDFIADIAYVQALRGETAAAQATLRQAKADPFEPFSIARAYVALRQPDSAFAWLDRANWQWTHRADRRDPALDPVRSDPRFATLSARIDREMGLK
jgi:serine/threonine protein kinase/Flp pilus assembly protein TadD